MAWRLTNSKKVYPKNKSSFVHCCNKCKVETLQSEKLRKLTCECSALDINDLPNEVIEMISSYLSKDDLFAFAQVHKRFDACVESHVRRKRNCGKVEITSGNFNIQPKFCHSMKGYEKRYSTLIPNVAVYAHSYTLQKGIVESYHDAFEFMRKNCAQHLLSLELSMHIGNEFIDLAQIERQIAGIETLVLRSCVPNSNQLSMLSKLKNIWVHNLPENGFEMLQSMHIKVPTFVLTTYEDITINFERFFQQNTKFLTVFTNNHSLNLAVITGVRVDNLVSIFDEAENYDSFMQAYIRNPIKNIASMHLSVNFTPRQVTPEIKSMHIYLHGGQLPHFVHHVAHFPRVQNLCLLLKNSKITTEELGAICKKFPNVQEVTIQIRYDINKESLVKSGMAIKEIIGYLSRGLEKMQKVYYRNANLGATSKMESFRISLPAKKRFERSRILECHLNEDIGQLASFKPQECESRTKIFPCALCNEYGRKYLTEKVDQVLHYLNHLSN